MARAVRRTRVGILVECGPDGLEVHLCRRICELLRVQHGAAFEERIVPLDNKGNLLQECAAVVEILLREGFDRVVILWDEEPGEHPLCWHNEKEHILKSMRGLGLNLRLIHLVCIERAFESWLLHDDRLLSTVLSRPTHPVRARPPKNPHGIKNPKGVMMRLFRRHRHTYVDVSWATRLAANLESLARLMRCDTFKRFAERVADTSF
jgi:hypothetical protein